MIASILIITTLPELGGCAITVRTLQRVPPEDLRPEEIGGRARVVGVTTAGGRRLTFDSLASRQTPDTLYAWLNATPLAVGRRSVVRLWVARSAEDPAPVEAANLKAALAGAPPIEGVTTVDGDSARFDRDGNAYVARDTLFATVAGRPYRLAVCRASVVWVNRKDEALSTVLSVFASALPIAALIGACSRGCVPLSLGR